MVLQRVDPTEQGVGPLCIPGFLTTVRFSRTMGSNTTTTEGNHMDAIDKARGYVIETAEILGQKIQPGMVIETRDRLFPSSPELQNLTIVVTHTNCLDTPGPFAEYAITGYVVLVDGKTETILPVTVGILTDEPAGLLGRVPLQGPSDPVATFARALARGQRAQVEGVRAYYTDLGLTSPV